MVIITNNKKVLDEINSEIEVVYHNVDSLELLSIIRDKVHSGSVLLSHPLSGSIKPNENPYKSVLVDEKVGNLDYKSLEIIENAISTFVKFKNMGIKPIKTNTIDEDYALIDFTLISSCL